MIRMKKSAKVWLRVLSLVLALMLLGSSAVFAADMDDVPYYSYCYWEGPSRTVAVPMRAMYEPTQQITSDSKVNCSVASYIARMGTATLRLGPSQ